MMPTESPQPEEIPESPVVEFAVREQEVATSLIVDLIDRMERAEMRLGTLAKVEDDDSDESEARRLRAKASGVRLCLSYAREALGMQE